VPLLWDFHQSIFLSVASLPVLLPPSGISRLSVGYEVGLVVANMEYVQDSLSVCLIGLVPSSEAPCQIGLAQDLWPRPLRKLRTIPW